ncbi:MAG: SUMF1/EgtB/PvdO family nonheme iron enzyme [Pirellulales bacterium]|nr:SUMF1/EgtB/PvdO family nonheme iron enzyme [Pirellulales bacterium]
MAISLDQFTQQLAGSGLISSDEIQSFVAALPADDKPLDAEGLARQLVGQRKLTAYQAKELYAGRGQSLVLGNYVILDKLGQGGMGLVLKAQHRRMERVVALKVLSPKVVRTPEALRRFQREVKAAARLTHPNIVIAHDADEPGGTHFLVMEYVDGSDLATRVKKHGPLPLERALDCILQAARGLQYAHENGVVHRDIKPANLLLNQRGTVKILDMGLARLDTAGAQQDQLTGTGQIMGTVDYMAPEQAMDTKHADARADIYSLGVTLWYLLVGRPLYAGETTVERLMAHQTRAIPSLREACAAASPKLEVVFAKMVAKKPAERYQTMAEVIAELEPLCGHAASAPAMDPSLVEDPQLDAFLRGLGTSAASSRPSPAAVKTKAAPAAPRAAADPDVTQDWSGPHVETATRMEPLLPRPESGKPGTTSARSAALRRSRPANAGSANWRDWRWLTAVGAGGLLVVLLGIWVVVRDKDGKEVARVPVPEGGTVTVETAAKNQAARREESGDKASHPKTSPAPLPPWNLPAGSPPPAIAPFDTKKAKEHQAAWAKYLGVEVESENSIGVKFVLIPPGEFDMGSTDAEVANLLEEEKSKNLGGWYYIHHLPSEAPKHRVRITKPFWLGRHEVTRGQFRRFVDDSGYQTEAERDGKGGYGLVNGQPKQDPRFVWNSDLGFEQADDHPVVNVHWNDVTAFCAWLSEKEGEKSCLPSEAQWEYACRVGTTTRFYSGDDEGALKEHAWFVSNAESKTHPVGQKSPNAWSLYDMHGNVWEWCQDWWSADYYGASPLEDPTGPEGGEHQVLRGGGWSGVAPFCRAACRHGSGPGFRVYDLGFRLARTVSFPPR